MDVRQEFQFGALGALLSYEIDIITTPDPLYKNNVEYLSTCGNITLRYFQSIFEPSKVFG
jgi:hypothetical protein